MGGGFSWRSIVNWARWRCYELQVSILNKNHRGRFGRFRCQRTRGTGLASRTWAYSLEQHNAFLCTVTGPSLICKQKRIPHAPRAFGIT